jgi:hypothetical protein
MMRFWLLICCAMILSLGAEASAAPPGFYDTPSANRVSPTTALLIVNVKSPGQVVRAWIEFSANSNLSGAQKLAEQTAQDGMQLHEGLTNLKPGTTYYFRGVARNHDGEAETGIQKFTTLAQLRPPSVEFSGNPRFSLTDLSLSFGCESYGAAADCVAMWSTSPSMSGEHELARVHLSAERAYGLSLNATFALSRVPDNTKIYVQGTIKNAAGKAQTPVKEFLIRNKPI